MITVVFLSPFQLNCPSALERIREDKPITIRDDKGNAQKSIADIVSLFITVMDKLKLDIRAVDDIHPEIRDLCDTFDRMASLPSEFEPKVKVHEWSV